MMLTAAGVAGGQVGGLSVTGFPHVTQHLLPLAGEDRRRLVVIANAMDDAPPEVRRAGIRTSPLPVQNALARGGVDAGAGRGPGPGSAAGEAPQCGHRGR